MGDLLLISKYKSGIFRSTLCLIKPRNRLRFVNDEVLLRGRCPGS